VPSDSSIFHVVAVFWDVTKNGRLICKSSRLSRTVSAVCFRAFSSLRAAPGRSAGALADPSHSLQFLADTALRTRLKGSSFVTENIAPLTGSARHIYPKRHSFGSGNRIDDPREGIIDQTYAHPHQSVFGQPAVEARTTGEEARPTRNSNQSVFSRLLRHDLGADLR
jgi:hypothetical protein